MNITRTEAARLGRRAEQPVKAAGELLAVFVRGHLVNPLNATAWGWRKRSQLAKSWKQRVAQALLESSWAQTTTARVAARTHKVVTFHAHTHNTMDGDGLQAALKPVRDALIECGVISGDADQDGHRFVYEQEIHRARRGVIIRVALRPTEQE